MVYPDDDYEKAHADAVSYVESIFMHTGEAIETFINYFELDFEHGIMSPKVYLTTVEIEALSNGKLFSALLNTDNEHIRKQCTREMRRRVYQLARQHGVIDEMVEKVANDIYNSDDFE